MGGGIEDIRVYKIDGINIDIRPKYKRTKIQTLCNIKIRTDFPLFLTETIRPYYNSLNLYYKYDYISLYIICGCGYSRLFKYIELYI